MKTISVYNITEETVSEEAGIALFEAITPYLDNDDEVNLSFSGLLRPSSTFLNASLIRLRKRYPREVFNSRIYLSGLSYPDAEFIKEYLTWFDD